MKIADLRSRISIQRKTSQEDAIGGRQPPSWEDVAADISANIQPLSSAEVYKLAQVRVTATHKVTVRIGHDIAEGDRVVYGSREFKIVGKPVPDKFDKAAWLTFTVDEGVRP